MRERYKIMADKLARETLLLRPLLDERGIGASRLVMYASAGPNLARRRVLHTLPCNTSKNWWSSEVQSQIHAAETSVQSCLRWQSSWVRSWQLSSCYSRHIFTQQSRMQMLRYGSFIQKHIAAQMAAISLVCTSMVRRKRRVFGVSIQETWLKWDEVQIRHSCTCGWREKVYPFEFVRSKHMQWWSC